jgi:primosomal protein N'
MEEMSMSEENFNFELLEKELEKRIQEISKEKPPFYPFSHEGDKLIGFIREIKDFKDLKGNVRKILIVESKDKKFYAVSATSSIQWWMNNLNIKVGDFVMFKLEKILELDDERTFKQFVVVKISKEEVEELLKKAEKLKDLKAQEVSPKISQELEKAAELKVEEKSKLAEEIKVSEKKEEQLTVLEQAKSPEAKVEAKLSSFDDELKKFREFLPKYMKFYPTIKLERLQKILEARFPSLSISDVLEHCSDIIVFDEANNQIVKKG